MGSASKAPSSIIQSVQRALDILDVFALRTPPLGISELAELTGLHKSTVSGLVQTLAANGYLNQDPMTRKYHLGLKLIERAFVRLNQIEMRPVAMPYLERLRDQCNEDVNLLLPDGGYHLIYIDRAVGPHSQRSRLDLGKRIHVHSSAAGKAILSCLPRSAVEQYIALRGLIPYTDSTITDPAQLFEELERTRDHGYGYDNEENAIGICSIASPILNHAAEPVGAISIDLQMQLVPDETVETLGRQILQTAKQVSLAMGYVPRPF